ncbi:MAG: hypothetical protein Q8R02_09625 [Hyphomonadaceae bacterium]|nr:hypothetical protein [Hyphomonadaceae bacterium]
MRGVVIFLGFLLLLGGGAVAGVQFAPPSLDLSFLASIPGAQDFLKTQTALFAGGGAAGFGLLLMIIGIATGGGKKRKAREPTAPPDPVRETRRAAAPEPKPEPRPKTKPAPAPMAAKPAPQPALQPATQTTGGSGFRPVPPPSVKPQASANPPPLAQPASHPASSRPATKAEDTGPTWSQDPRFTNRKRVSDLVTINDAIKAYHAKNGAYPKADGLKGFPDRGKAWVPGLSPDFIAELPRDPALSNDREGPQYLYVSNGADYKLLAHGIALAGGTNVEVLGVRIDPSKQNTMEKAAFGFWTEAFASV